MAKKVSNKARKVADKALRKITNEEYDENSERYRDKKTGEYTRAPKKKE